MGCKERIKSDNLPCIKELGKEKIIISFLVNLALVQKHINEEERWLLHHAGFWNLQENLKRLVILFANLTERGFTLVERA